MSAMISLLVASFCGSLLGLERESEGKAAGLRTHLLVALGAALATQLSLQVTGYGTPSFADPGRIAAQVVSGIGFIGAGVILQSRGSIRGLTTAATLWVAAMIGMAAGVEAYLQAGAVTLIALVALRGLSRLDTHFRDQARWHVLEIIWTGSPERLDLVVEKVLSDAGREPPAHSVEGVFVREGEVGCRLRIRERREAVSQVILTLGRAPEVKEVRTL
jgi:putative Mg2+ transporter-C (MgtC) family protein